MTTLPNRDLFSPELPIAGALPGMPALICFQLDRIHLGVRVEPVLIDETSFELVPSEEQISDDTLFRQAFTGSWLRPEPLKRELNCDVFALRAAFEAVSSRQEFISFLASCGPFISRADALTNKPGIALSFNRFREWQAFLKTAKLRGRITPFDKLPGFGPYTNPSVSEWRTPRNTFFHDLFRFKWQLSTDVYDKFFGILDPEHRTLEAHQLSAMYLASSAMDAIGATLELEFLNGAKYRQCLYCAAVFLLGHRPERAFCNDLCRNSHGQRRRRAAARLLTEAQD